MLPMTLTLCTVASLRDALRDQTPVTADDVTAAHTATRRVPCSYIVDEMTDQTNVYRVDSRDRARLIAVLMC